MPVPINITGLENVNRGALEEAMMEQEAPEITEPSNHSRDQEAPAHHGNDIGAQNVDTRSETGPGGELTVEIEEEAFEEIPRPISPLPPPTRTTIPSRFEEYLDQNRRWPKLLIERYQIPLLPALACTAHFAQGKTLEAAVVDLCIGEDAGSSLRNPLPALPSFRQFHEDIPLLLLNPSGE